MTTYLNRSVKPGDSVPLPSAGGLPDAVHVFDDEQILAVDAALATRRPLLVRGEPGTGKSQLARAAASALGRAYVSTVVDARTETRDLLWFVDSVARLAEAQTLAAQSGVDGAEIRDRVALRRFVHPGPLWWAFHWHGANALPGRGGAQLCARQAPDGWTPERGCVLLIDEIDKADGSVPNGLLEALGHGRFEGPDGEVVEMAQQEPPLVVITTNEERALPDAFLRRCLVLHLELPRRRDELVDLLVSRGARHFGQCSPEVLRLAAELLADDRAAVGGGVCPPGQAEYLDLVRAVTEQESSPEGQSRLMERVKRFVLRKHPSEEPAS